MAENSMTTTGDAVDLLLAQHREVRRLFGQIEGAGGEQRKEMFECLVRLLAVHETAEEEVIYPLVRSAVPDGEALVKARTEEESKAKDELSQLEKIGPDSAEFPSRLSGFKSMVESHAGNEEQQVFPALRQHVDAGKLTKARKMLETAESMAPTHPHPHGPESAIGNLLVGPMVAVVDRVRDTLRKAS